MSSVTEHIEMNPAKCGGKPCIAGTRIRVWDIHVWHDLQGQAPAEIIASFPQLTLGDVYAALAYYHDHRDAIQAQMQEAEKLVERMKAENGPGLLDQVRNRGGDGDSISS